MPRWNPSDDRKILDILRHDSAGADDGTISDPGAAGGHDCISSDPNVMSYTQRMSRQIRAMCMIELVEKGVGGEPFDGVILIIDSGAFADRGVPTDFDLGRKGTRNKAVSI